MSATALFGMGPNSSFSVRPLCSLCPCGGSSTIAHHRVTETTEDAQKIRPFPLYNSERVDNTRLRSDKSGKSASGLQAMRSSVL